MQQQAKEKVLEMHMEREQMHVEFSRTKKQLFDRWCTSTKVDGDWTVYAS